MSPVKVLLTGATGFIGSHLLDTLAQADIEARGCVRSPTSHSGARSSVPLTFNCALDRIERWGPEALAGIDVVIHTAALAHVPVLDTREALERYRTVNTHATRRLAELAAAQGVKRFIFLSSIKVNGERTGGDPFTADDKPNPVGPYAISKYEAEQALWEVAEKTGLEVVIIRPSLVYGPGVKANFAQLSRWVRRGVPLPLAGIENSRSLVSVYNLVDLMIHCLKDSRAAGQTFLVSDGECVSTPELITRLARAWGVYPRLFHLPGPLLEWLARRAGREQALQRLSDNLEVDIEFTSQALDWSPPCSMAETLGRMVDFERSRSRGSS